MEGLPKDLRRELRRRLHPVDGLMYLAACCPSFDPVPEADTHGLGSYCGKHGHLALLQYASITRPSIGIFAGLAAAEHGHLNVLEWILSKGFALYDSVCARAVRGNQLETLKWAVVRGYPLTPKCAYYATANGHLEILQWLYSKDRECIRNVHAITSAVTNGHLNVLKWLYEERVVFQNARFCSEAAVEGHLHILIWLRELNCPWGSTVMQNAAGYNRLPTLQWALANGCPVDERGWLIAAANGHVDILRWGYESGHLTVAYIQRISSYAYSPKVGAWLESLKG